ncbi:MAG: hypothetical protein GTO18_18965 [Anaerolineales bacterium]|nr:hypothetical protein [Anaerolineales bacterium]
MSWEIRFQNEILRRLRKSLADLGLQENEDLLRKINDEIERIIVEYSHLVVDEKTHPHLRLTACVLASHQAIASGPLDQERALELVGDAFVGIGRTMLKLYTLALLTFSKDPFIAITKIAKKRTLERYGGAWELSFEETEDSFTITTTKCFYHDFFTAASAQHCTQIFCRWDKNWIEPIDPAKHGILFERPMTIGYGGEECPFIFKRVESSTR